MTPPPLITTLERFPKWLIVSAAILFSALVAWADVVLLGGLAGHRVSLWLLFVLPVLVTAYTVNLHTAVLLAFLAAMTSLFEIPAENGRVAGAALWEAFSRFVLLGVIAVHGRLWKRARDQTQQLRLTDSLTGLLNSRGFLERTDAERNRCSRSGQPLTLVYMDCDEFKAVNDTLGHLAGDAVLETIAATLRSHIRSYDVAGRWGGDEFVLLLPETSTATARLVVERVHEALQNVMNAHAWPVTFSIGAVTFTEPEPKASEMLRAADQLMLQVKRSTKNGAAYKTINAGQPAEMEILQ